MADDDQLSTWIGRPEAAIKRSGELKDTEVAGATVAFLRNGTDLLIEARLLVSKGKLARGASLIVLGHEELAKIKIIVDTFLKFDHGLDPEAWLKYWKSGGVHKIKQEEILSYGSMVKPVFYGDPIHDRYLYRYYAPADALTNLDWFKQSNLYVDIREDGVHVPGESENLLKATDYLIVFAQERADSYRSWHVSPQRAMDQLQVALGKRPQKSWTQSFRVEEVYGDLLYQASALSASYVPNYFSFNDYVRSYLKKNVSESRVKDALLILAQELRGRIDDAKDLPLFHARTMGTFKLIFALAENSEIFNKSFNQKLKEYLKH